MIVNALLLLIGIALLLGGLWWVYPPLALITGGVVLAVLGFTREVPDGNDAG